jgi:mRNA interferase RelE/StbE
VTPDHYRVEHTDAFARDLRKLDRVAARRILAFLATRIDGHSDPRRYGRALTGAALGGLWRYRVGDYRVIVDIRDDALIVLAIHTDHRSGVYR